MSNAKWLFIKPGNTGTENGMRGMQGKKGMFTKIPRYVPKDSGKCSRKFQRIFHINPRNVRENSGNMLKDSGKCSKSFRRMFQKILVNFK